MTSFAGLFVFLYRRISSLKASNSSRLTSTHSDSFPFSSYVYYCICAKQEELLAKKEGARGDLNSTRILSLQIDLPALEEQKRIVSILDRFDTICNDLTSGLPAEIEARQKQYEYYRDKLLTFEERG